MKLSELLKGWGMLAKVARETNLSSATLCQRAKTGWKVGILDGKAVMYNPKAVTKLEVVHKKTFKEWDRENGES